MSQSYSTPFMSIKDGYANKKVTFDTLDNLEEKIEGLPTMMSKLQLKMIVKINSVSLKYIRVEEEVRQKCF